MIHPGPTETLMLGLGGGSDGILQRNGRRTRSTDSPCVGCNGSSVLGLYTDVGGGTVERGALVESQRLERAIAEVDLGPLAGADNPLAVGHVLVCLGLDQGGARHELLAEVHAVLAARECVDHLLAVLDIGLDFFLGFLHKL